MAEATAFWALLFPVAAIYGIFDAEVSDPPPTSFTLRSALKNLSISSQIKWWGLGDAEVLVGDWAIWMLRFHRTMGCETSPRKYGGVVLNIHVRRL